MKKILLICYYFPPLGLGGVGRPLNLFKKLPGFQYDCHILTVKPVTYRHYEPELLEGLDTNRIFRSGSRDPQRLMYLLGIRKVSSGMIESGHKVSERFFPDSKEGWVKPAIRLGRTLLNNYRYNAVISTSPPVSSHLVARRLAAEYGVPWVADFRDFWTSYKIEATYTGGKNIQKGLKLLADIKKETAALTVVNRTLAEYFNTDEIIPNGYDDDLAELWREPQDTKYFHIGLLGHQHEDKAVTPFFEVLSHLKTSAPSVFDRVRIIQVGQVDRVWFEQSLDRFGLKDKCAIHGFKERKETVRILSEVSLFYIGLEAAGEQKIMPARMYDLLASGRQIIAYVARESEIARLLDETGAGMFFDDTTIMAAVAFLQRQVDLSGQGKLPIKPLPAYARSYSSSTMAEKFARLLDRLT